MSIGVWQIAIVLLIVVMLFGAGKLPQVMGDMAKSIRTFKAGMKDELDPVAPASPPEAKVEPKPLADATLKKDEGVRG
jgi:sec-independent protein translocase protein TatA